MSEPRYTIAQLIEYMQEALTPFNEMISGLTETQLTTPGPDGGWSVKDHLAHMAMWEIGVAALLRREHRWEAMGLTQEFVDEATEEEINAAIEANHKNLSLAEARELFDYAHRDLLAALDALTDDDLYETYSHFQPWVKTDNEQPIINRIVGNTRGHWEDHTPWIRKILDSQAGA
jgi:hypothetical protein